MDPPRISHLPSTRLHVAALIFGFVVTASWLEQTWLLQIRRDFAWPFLHEVFTYASRSYLTSFRGFESFFRAMLLLEGLALLIYVARYTRDRPDFGQRLAVMIVAGAVGTAVLTVWHVSAELLQYGQTREGLLELLAARRWKAHISDINAAGSFFAMGMFIALGVALRRGPSSVCVDCGRVPPRVGDVGNLFSNSHCRDAAHSCLSRHGGDASEGSSV